jgi:TPP-dependent 2-oxoacid decarboxylase
MSNEITINEYLVSRLLDAGLDHVFGVPGDYVLDLLDHLTKSPIKWIGTCNELNGGYAADGYARINGLGAAIVTYGVGAFSILNAAAGAYAEQIPLIIISGSPHSARREANALMHHLTKDYWLQYDIYKKVTIDSAILTNPLTAPDEIDRVISNCITEKRPVYLEIPMDIGKKPARQPQKITYLKERKSDAEILQESVNEAAEKLNSAKNPVVLVGLETLRFGLTKSVLKLVEHLELPFATTLSSKSALPEFHPQFIGMYQGSMSPENVKKQLESSDCVLSLGVWMTDFDTGGFTTFLDEMNMINVTNESIKIKRHTYNNVWIGDFIDKLTETAKPRDYLASHPSIPFKQRPQYIAKDSETLTAKRFYERFNHFLDDDMIFIAEPGDSISAAAELQIEEADNFVVQAYYLSIGYCTPAALGVALAKPTKRVVVMTGDGAFQLTAQEVSSLMRHKTNVIIFLINNGGYLIERLLHEDGYYNDLQNWNYHKLPAVFGENSIGIKVETEGELENALSIAKKEKDKVIFIEIIIKNNECSDTLLQLAKNLRK